MAKKSFSLSPNSLVGNHGEHLDYIDSTTDWNTVLNSGWYTVGCQEGGGQIIHKEHIFMES